MKLLKILSKVICRVVLFCVASFSAFSQSEPASTVRRFEPAAWTTGDRIHDVENGLITSPVLIAGEPLQKVSLEQMMKSRQTPGLSLAVIDNYKLVWAKGYGITDVRANTQITPETLFSAGGITKAVTAVAVLRLADAKKINLDQDVNTLLKQWKIPANQFSANHPVTLRQLLSHASGVEGHYPTAYAVGDPTPTLLQVLRGEAPAKNEPVHVEHIPGTLFDYSSSAFLVVQQVLTDVLQQPFPEIIRAQVFKPAGMNHSTFDQPKSASPDPGRASGHIFVRKEGTATVQPVIDAFPELASAGLWSTPSDLALFLISLQKSGQAGGLLSRSSYNQIVKPLVANAGLGFFLAGNGSSLRLRVRGSDARSDDPFVGWLVGYVHDGKGAVVMANASNAFTVGFSLLRSIATEYGWREYVPVRTVETLDPKVLQPYVGNYQLGPSVVTISADGGTLFGQINKGPKVPLYATSASTFFVNTDLLHEAEVRFVQNSSGVVDELILHYPFEDQTALRIP